MKILYRHKGLFGGLAVLLLVLSFGSVWVYGEEETEVSTSEEVAQSQTSQAAESSETLSQTEETTDTAPVSTADATDTIFQGISIGNVDVSGMTAAEATAAVEAYIDNGKSYLLTLDMNGTTVPVTAGDLGLHWGNPEVVNEAVEMGRQGNAVVRYKAQKELEKGQYTFSMDCAITDSVANSILTDRCAKIFDKKPVEPIVAVGTTGTQIVEGQQGVSLNIEKSLQAIKDYLNTQWTGGAGTISLVYEVTEPKHTSAELSSITSVLGKSSTDYSSSSEARSTNIRTAASLINGTVLFPGESFSTLEAITPFTEENGYALAGSYANGQVTESFGGGICQVSTTLYLAVLRAELEVTERKNHSMIVTYVKPSMDAAIAESSDKDFKFTNNLDQPIYIYMEANNGTLSCSIYGTEYRDANRTVEYESVTISSEEPETKIKTTAKLKAGVINRLQSAHAGIVAELYKVVKVNGVEESREKVNSSTYTKTNASIEVGIQGMTSAEAQEVYTACATGELKTVKATLAKLGY